MNCWYWMNRRNPCGGEVEEVGSVCDGQLLPNVRGSLVQSPALQHHKPSLDIKTFLNEINACVCPGSSSVNYRTMWNLEKRLFNLKVAAGESKGKVTWQEEKNKEEIAEKKITFRKAMQKQGYVWGMQSVRKTKQSVSWEWALSLRLRQPEFKLKPREDSCLCQHVWTLIWNTECSNAMSGKKDEKCYRPDNCTPPTEYAVPEAAGEADLETGYSKKQAGFSEVSSSWSSVAGRNSSCSLCLFLKQPGVCLGGGLPWMDACMHSRLMDGWTSKQSCMVVTPQFAYRWQNAST